MARPGLKIEIDEPGRRLVLGGAPPSGARSVLAGCVLAFLSSAAVTVFWRPALLISYALGGVVIGLARKRLDVITRLAFDGSTGHIDVTTLGAIGSARVISHPLATLGGMRVKALWPLPTPRRGDSPGLVRLRLRLLYGSDFWARHSRRFTAEGVATLAQAGDLARRMAAAVGFEHETVVRADPRELTLDFRVEATPGSTPLQDMEAR